MLAAITLALTILRKACQQPKGFSSVSVSLKNEQLGGYLIIWFGYRTEVDNCMF
jgi:hypothetical protein